MITDTNKLLLQLLQKPLPINQLKNTLAQLSEPEWQALITAAGRFNLEPMLYASIKALPAEIHPPPDLLSALRDTYLRSIKRNVLILNHMALLLKAFQDQNLDVIGLKGIFLLDNIYQNIGLRSLGDVDLIVRKEDLPKAVACAQALGYNSEHYFNFSDENPDLKHYPQLFNRDGLTLEVHWTISRELNPFEVDIDAMWARAVPSQIAGVPTLALSPADRVLHLSIHAIYQHDLTGHLRDLVDIRDVLTIYQDEFDWDMLVELAKAWGAERVVGLTFQLLEHLLAFRVPAAVQGALLPAPIDPEIIPQALEVLFLERETRTRISSSNVARLPFIRGVRNKANIILSRIFLPKVEMARYFQLPETSWRVVFFYPVRVVQLISRHTGTYLRLKKRDTSGEEAKKAAYELQKHDQEKTLLKQWLAKK